MQTFTVPTCVTTVTITVYGAQGENALVGGATGGLGGSATGELTVTPSQVLNIFVGGRTGYNGGGQGGINGNDQNSSSPIGTKGGWGGGASDVRANGTSVNDRVIVGGGGGGAGHNGVWQGCQVAGPGGNGGAGGGTTGSPGTDGVGTPCSCGGGGGGGGTGGTQLTGGVHGSYAGSTACLRSTWGAGADGTLAQGGAGSQTSYYNGSGGSGGGGGGYYGGGSGGQGSDTTPGGGGGGGSSYTGGVTNASTASGVRAGDGMVTIAYTVAGSLPASPVNFAGPSGVCPGETFTYSIDPVATATSYTWSAPAGWNIVSGQGTTSITVDAGTMTSTLSVYATNSCGDGAASTVTVTVYAPQSPSLGADTASCNAITLTAAAAQSYVWCGGETTQSVIAMMTGVYCVTIIDMNGCSASDSVTVTIYPTPVVVASAAMNMVCLADDLVQLFGSPAGGTFSGTGVVNGDQFDAAAAGAGAHDIVYSYTDSLGCSAMDTTTITVDLCLGMAMNEGASFNVYPNPASSTCVITFVAEVRTATIEITSLQGQVIQSQQVNNVAAGAQTTISLHGIAAGTYMLNVVSAEGRSVRTLIVQ